ncbi:hypothetical protein MTP03_09620 [Tsukamurella sp. PLM1]|nr:hypothetical protein MTP03_09620 [Tsukamurella sp. PLM1]
MRAFAASIRNFGLLVRAGAAAQPGQLLAGEVLPLLLDGRRLPVALDALQDVRGVTALERLDDAVVHLPGRGADLVEDPPVVGHHQQPALVRGPAVLEMAGEPLDGLDVQVVGRLVEDQHVVLAREQLRQLHPAALPAGQLAESGVPRQVGEQAGEDVAYLRVARPDVLLGIADHRVAHGVLVVEQVGLGEHANPDAAPSGHAPGVGLAGACQHAEQAGLAVAVAADDADPVALVHAEGHRIEHRLGRVLEVQRIRAEKIRHRRSRLRGGLSY